MEKICEICILKLIMLDTNKFFVMVKCNYFFNWNSFFILWFTEMVIW